MKKKSTIDTEGGIKFGNPFYSETEGYKKPDEEKFEVILHGVVTKITCKFIDGVLISFSSTSEKIQPNPKRSPPKVKPTTKKPKERFIKKRS